MSIENEYGFKLEGKHIAVPQVIIDPKILSGDLPYRVTVDDDGIGNLFRDLGASEEQITNSRVKVKRKAKFNPFFYTGAKIAGSYSPFTTDLTIYTDWVWERYNQTLNASRRIAKGTAVPFLDKRLINKRLSTNRLPEYLNEAPYERGMSFASDLIWRAEQRKMDGMIVHESGHKRDHEEPVLRTLMYGYGFKGVVFLGIVETYEKLASNHIPVVSHDLPNLAIHTFGFVAYSLPLMRVEYKFDPLENSARQLARDLDGKYPNLVTISKK